MKGKGKWLFLIVFLDWLVSTVVWCLFFFFRKTWIEGKEFRIDQNFISGIIVVPLVLLLIYYLQGTYLQIRRMYRVKILQLTFIASLTGSLVIFFSLLLDDEVTNYQGIDARIPYYTTLN